MLDLVRPGTLDRVSQRWNLGFSNVHEQAANMPKTAYFWVFEDTEGNCAWAHQPEAWAENHKALIAAELTASVVSAEVIEWLPPIDCRAMHDRFYSEQGFRATLSTFIARAAVNVCEFAGALKYNRHWLGISVNPLKDCCAYLHLGSTITKVRSGGLDES